MNTAIKAAVGFFIGENSHKREIGVFLMAAFTILFQLDYLTSDQYEAVMGVVITFTGIAWNLRIKKIQEAFLAAKR